MHLPDGIIPMNQAIIYWIISLIFLSLYLYKSSKLANNFKRIIIMAMFAAVTIVASSITIPSPFGVPIHFFIIPLVVILLGPLSGMVVEFVCLLIQALFLGLGGIVCLGANTMVIGVSISFVTYIFFKVIKDLNENFAIFCATVLGIISATIVQALILIISGFTTLEIILSTLIPFYLFVAVVEGIITVIIVNFIKKSNQEFINLEKI